jgi:uncharacterized membrane protein YfcA
MKSTIERINMFLVMILAFFVISGLLMMAIGQDKFATNMLLVAAVITPIFLATKGIEFIVEHQLRKAFVSILLLSVVCLLAILFVFV